MQIDLAPFLVISILLILIPGPDTAVVTKNVLIHQIENRTYEKTARNYLALVQVACAWLWLN